MGLSGETGIESGRFVKAWTKFSFQSNCCQLHVSIRREITLLKVRNKRTEHENKQIRKGEVEWY